MKEIFWYKFGDEKIKDLEKIKTGIVGCRLILELLWRSGIGCIRYVGDFVTPNDVKMDVTLKPLEANNYDVVHPMSDDSYIVSYPYEGYDELKRQLKGCDVIIAHKHLHEAAKVAERLGAIFIPNFVTIFLPDGISFFEVELPKIEYDPISYSLTCSLQAGELIRLVTGYKTLAIAPEAYIVRVTHKKYFKKLRLKLKKNKPNNFKDESQN